MKYLSKAEVIERLKRYRFVKNQIFEIMGGWVQFIPEVEVKIHFGRQFYTDAFHSELLKQRLSYLGARTDARQISYSGKMFMDFLEDVWHSADKTAVKLYAVDVLLRSMIVDTMREHLENLCSRRQGDRGNTPENSQR